jgi:hypothetical protein
MEWKTEELGSDSRQRAEIILITFSTTAMGYSQLPIQCVLGTFFRELKWPELAVDHSCLSSYEVKNA